MWMRLLTLLLVLALTACATSRPVEPEVKESVAELKIKPAEAELSEAQKYFLEIALRSEFGDNTPLIRRWERPVRLYMDADKPQELIDEALAIIDEIRQLVPSIDVAWVDTPDDANVKIFFGPYKEFSKKYAPKSRKLLRRNWGFFSVRSHANNLGIESANMYVDTRRAKQSEQRKHLLREELTQLFGLMADSKRYPDSIFYQNWTTTTEYSELDKALIRMLYDKSILSGMDEQAIRLAWQEIGASVVSTQLEDHNAHLDRMGNER